MFNRIRQLHLYAAFVLTTFVVMYFVSGFVMIFEDNFKREKISQEEVVREIPGIHTSDADSLIARLKNSFQVHGQYTIHKDKGGQTMVNFRRPGTETDLVISAKTDSVSVTIKKQNFITVLHALHRLRGYNGGWNYYAWAFMFDLSALSMIVFALSGVYLWYKNERNRNPGWIVIASFTLFTGFTICYLLYLS
jgi:hypothetical protein